MMNANELRINNWVEYEGRYFQLYAIDANMPFLNTAEFGVGVVDYNNIFPIPLSPEILEKCGFELNRNNELSIEINDIASHLELMSGTGGFYYPSFTQTPQGDEERTVYFNRINSLHQLQNLYFSLCGEELTITSK